MADAKAAMLQELQPVRDRLINDWCASGHAYPPARITLLAIKSQRSLELWQDHSRARVLIKTYAILAASGSAGPKLFEGDGQVPEGIYKVTTLNPQSNYHLSLRLNYPNAFDARWAAREQRRNPGSDIYIHGGAESVGCIAIGDRAIEEVYVLVAEVGVENVTVIISPDDPRASKLEVKDSAPWVAQLYRTIEREIRKYTKAEH